MKALTTLDERLNGEGRGFDVYIGCSAGSVVASFLANGIQAAEIYRVLEHDLPDPLNLRRAAVFSSDSFRHVAGRVGRSPMSRPRAGRGCRRRCRC